MGWLVQDVFGAVYTQRMRGVHTHRLAVGAPATMPNVWSRWML
jgi:hypothetical protein